MIFSNKVCKLSSGKNISLFAESQLILDLFVFNNQVKRKLIKFLNSPRCEDSGENYSYNKVIKINQNHLLICLDKNVSIIDS